MKHSLLSLETKPSLRRKLNLSGVLLERRANRGGMDRL